MTRKARRLETLVMDAVEANREIHPTRILVEMERAVGAMHSKNYGPDGHAGLMVDLVLCIVNPKFRDVWTAGA